MNGFSTEEDSHDGPPAPPFYGQSCCLIEDGERCGRSAGNASFSKRIQKSISQKKLKLDIDKSVSGAASRRRAVCVCVRELEVFVRSRLVWKLEPRRLTLAPYSCSRIPPGLNGS